TSHTGHASSTQTNTPASSAALCSKGKNQGREDRIGMRTSVIRTSREQAGATGAGGFFGLYWYTSSSVAPQHLGSSVTGFACPIAVLPLPTMPEVAAETTKATLGWPLS